MVANRLRRTGQVSKARAKAEAEACLSFVLYITSVSFSVENSLLHTLKIIIPSESVSLKCLELSCRMVCLVLAQLDVRKLFHLTQGVDMTPSAKLQTRFYMQFYFAKKRLEISLTFMIY